jgi:hypothetical protein
MTLQQRLAAAEAVLAEAAIKAVGADRILKMFQVLHGVE